MVGMVIVRLDWSEGRWVISLDGSSGSDQKNSLWGIYKTPERVLLLLPDALCVPCLDFSDTLVAMRCSFLKFQCKT
jgi:hypothetical protein